MIGKARNKKSISQAVDAYLFDLRAAGRSPHTIESYAFALKDLGRFLEAQRIRDWAKVGPSHLRRYLVTFQAELKPSTIRTRATAISCFFNWLGAEKLVASNPMLRVRRPKKPQRITPTFTESELRAMFAAVKQTPDPVRDKAILCLLLDCGLRVSELLAVKPSDYDPSTATLTVRGKGRKVRLLKMGQYSRQAFEEHLEGANGDFWGLVRREGVAYLTRHIGKLVGTKANPHKFRHTFAMRFLDAGGTIDELQYLMGHSHISTTMIYARAGQEQRALRSHAEHSPLDALF